MCQRISKHDVALSLSRLTGKGFENSWMDVNRLDRPNVFTSLGNFDIGGFGRLARLEGVSDFDITMEVSRLTGRSFESSLMELNRIHVKPFK